MVKELGNFESLQERMNLKPSLEKMSYDEERQAFLSAKKQLSKENLKIVIEARKKSGLPID